MKRILLLILLSGFALLRADHVRPGPPPIVESLRINESDLVFDKPTYVSSYGPLMPFDASVTGPGGRSELSPTYEFYLHANAPSIIPLTGIVVERRYQPAMQDHVIWIKDSRRSKWVVIDHIRHPQVGKHERVKVYQMIGEAGTGYSQQGIGQTELMVVTETRPHYSYCPYLFLDDRGRRRMGESFRISFGEEGSSGSISRSLPAASIGFSRMGRSMRW